MTIEEVKQERYALQNLIQSLIADFENKTGASIKKIDTYISQEFGKQETHCIIGGIEIQI